MQVALLRGVNVGGHRRVPMAELRAAMAAAGFADVRTYVASGNLLFADAGAADAIEARVAAIVADAFGVTCDVIVRDAATLAAHVAANPFPDPARGRPKLLHVLLARRPFAPGIATALAARAAPGEAVAETPGALWIDYATGAGRSKLTPVLIDRLAGSGMTARNWSTLITLVGMAGL